MLECLVADEPAPLQPLGLPVHFGAIAVNNDCAHGPQQFRQCVASAAGKDGEHGELSGDLRPQPGLLRRLLAQSLAPFLVRLTESGGHLVWHLHRERRAAGQFQQILQEVGRSSFALAEVPHQPTCEAVSRGPDSPCRTPAGRVAQVNSPQRRHCRRSKRCSITRGQISGNSQT